MERTALSDRDRIELVKFIQAGFPGSIDEVHVCLKPYYKIREKLSVRYFVILYNKKVVIPTFLRSLILEKLHSAHEGVSSMLSRTETCVFWPGRTHVTETKLAR